MMKIICIFLVVILIFSLAGCGERNSAPDVAVNFYYCTPSENYKNIRKTILPEVREGAGFENNMSGLVNIYLKGPLSESLSNPFPDNCTVMTLLQEDNEIQLVMNSNFAKLSGIDLVMASSCISYTLFELSQCDRVQISVENLLLDGNQSITIHRSDLLLEHFSE